MLRRASAHDSAISTRSFSNYERDGEKDGKIAMQRRQQSKLKLLLMVLGIIAILSLVVMVKLRHAQKYAPKLRKRSLHKGKSEELKLVDPGSFIPPNSIYKLSVDDLFGNAVSLEKYYGMVTLVVNVACLWGKTKVNYEQLAILHEKYKSRGFSVLAFPTNDFRQELGSNEEIQDFIDENFDQVNFPIFGLSSLKENVVYQQLKRQLPESNVRHNFFKYLVDRNGKAVKLYHKKEDPLSLTGDIEELLDANSARKQKLVTH